MTDSNLEIGSISDTRKKVEDPMVVKLREWAKAASELAEAKKLEMELRLELCGYILQGKIEGSKSANIGANKVTATARLNSSIDRDALKVIWPDLSKEEKEAVRFKPEVVAANHRKLPADSILNQVITKKPGAPSLAIKE